MEVDPASLFPIDADDGDNDKDKALEFADPKEYVVYLVDAAHDMFLPVPSNKGGGGKDADDGEEEDEEEVWRRRGEDEGEGERTYFGAVLRCVAEDLKARIVSRDYDRVAVVLFNTKERRSVQSSAGVFVVHDLSQPSASIIRDVTTLPHRFDVEVGSGNPLSASSARDNPLYNALWVAQSLLAVGSGSSKAVMKRILVFTNCDDPFGDVRGVGAREDMRRTTIQRAKDVASMNISVELFPMSRPGEEFNVSIFYKDAIQGAGGSDDVDAGHFMEVAKGRFDDLVNRMRKRMLRKRMVRRIRVVVGGTVHGVGGAEIALRSYALVRPTKISKSVLLDARNNTPLKVDTVRVCQDTGAVLKGPVKRAQVLGRGQNATRVVFDEHELEEQLKGMAPTNRLTIVGFKPLSALHDYHNIRPSTFLYPDEHAGAGSTTAFIALHHAMVRHERFAVAWASESGLPRLVALLAQEEVVSADGMQTAPGGWNMVPLPFCEDIRDIHKVISWSSENAQKAKRGRRRGGSEGDNEEDDGEDEGEAGVPVASAEQVAAASTLIRRMRIKNFSLLDVQNPMLQTHYAMLQAKALDEEDIPPILDSSLPNAKALARPAIRHAAAAFKDAVFGEGFDERETEKAAAQRDKAEAVDRKRRQMTEAASRRAAHVDWEELADSGKLESLTVEDLRSYLRTHKLLLTGRKKELVDRILKHLGR